MTNLIIKPTNEQIEYTKEVMQTWGGERGFFDGTPEEKERGILSQIVVCDVLGRPRTIDLSQQDEGVDFYINNQSYDVKSRQIRGIRDRPEYNNIVPDTQMSYKTDVFVFIIWNTDKLDFEIPGWITKEEFKQKGTLRKKGEKETHGLIFKVDTWTLQSRYLKPFSELQLVNSNSEDKSICSNPKVTHQR